MAKKRRSLEYFLVASGNQSVVADGSTSLTDSAGACNLASGQLGVFHAGLDGTNTMNTAISVGDTVVESPEIFIAQGTVDAASPGFKSLGQMAITNLKSHRIIGRNAALWKGTAYVAPVLNAWVIGADAANADAIGTPLDETEYAVHIAFSSRRHDEAFTKGARDAVKVSFTTPDYTTLGTTNPLDHFIQNMVYELNRNSRLIVTNGTRGQKPFIAFAVRHEGSFSGTGVAVSVLDSLAGGQAYPSYYGFSTDAETGSSLSNSQQGATWAALVAASDNDIDVSTQVVNVNLATAGTNANGANGIVIMALDELLAYEDRIPEVKVKLTVGLPEGFKSTVGLYSTAYSEGGWSPRQVRLFFNDTQGQRYNGQNRLLDPIIKNVDINDYVSDSAVYDVYMIKSSVTEEFMISPNNTTYATTYIFVPTTGTTTKANLEAVLNAYFGSVNLPNVNV